MCTPASKVVISLLSKGMAVNSSTNHAQAKKEDHHEIPSRHGIHGEQDAAARHAAMRLATMIAVPAALKAAIELGVF